MSSSIFNNVYIDRKGPFDKVIIITEAISRLKNRIWLKYYEGLKALDGSY